LELLHALWGLLPMLTPQSILTRVIAPHNSAGIHTLLSALPPPTGPGNAGKWSRYSNGEVHLTLAQVLSSACHQVGAKATVDNVLPQVDKFFVRFTEAYADAAMGSMAMVVGLEVAAKIYHPLAALCGLQPMQRLVPNAPRILIDRLAQYQQEAAAQAQRQSQLLEQRKQAKQQLLQAQKKKAGGGLDEEASGAQRQRSLGERTAGITRSGSERGESSHGALSSPSLSPANATRAMLPTLSLNEVREEDGAQEDLVDPSSASSRQYNVSNVSAAATTRVSQVQVSASGGVPIEPGGRRGSVGMDSPGASRSARQGVEISASGGGGLADMVAGIRSAVDELLDSDLDDSDDDGEAGLGDGGDAMAGDGDPSAKGNLSLAMMDDYGGTKQQQQQQEVESKNRRRIVTEGVDDGAAGLSPTNISGANTPSSSSGSGISFFGGGNPGVGSPSSPSANQQVAYGGGTGTGGQQRRQEGHWPLNKQPEDWMIRHTWTAHNTAVTALAVDSTGVLMACVWGGVVV
jgi:hypothetical protein